MSQRRWSTSTPAVETHCHNLGCEDKVYDRKAGPVPKKCPDCSGPISQRKGYFYVVASAYVGRTDLASLANDPYVLSRHSLHAEAVAAARRAGRGYVAVFARTA